MNIARIFCIGFLILTFSLLSTAQTVDDKTKEIALLEEILADAANLRLAENRALVYAQVGDKLWKVDEQKARGLFQNSIDELLTAQREAEFEKINQPSVRSLIYGQHPRWQILNLFANRDAEFALDALIKSRPPKLQTALNQLSANKENSNRYSNYTSYTQTEIQSEQRYASLAAKQNPARMPELFRSSLKKKITYDTFNLLQQIQQKDLDLANKLAEETLQALLKISLNNGENVGVFYHFFNLFGNDANNNNQQIKISENYIRQMADKLSTFWLSQNYQSDDITSNAFKAVEKNFPIRAAEYKQRQEKRKVQSENQNPEHKRYTELMKSNPSAELLLKESKKFTNYRSSIYNTALQKLTEEGNIAELKSVLKNDFTEEESNSRLTQYYSNLASNLTSKGNYDEALAVINEIPDEENRFSPIIQLANAIYYKNPKENKQQALTILRRADALITEIPDNQNDVNKRINLANAYSIIEPAEGFRLIETIINPINEYTKAYIVVSQFRSEGIMRQGEFIISMGADATRQFNLGQAWQSLKNEDFDQTVQLINRFEQIETRISLKLQMISSITNSQILNLPVNTTRFSNVTVM
ncbi:MAG: hypothetical protein M3405_11590 [Acidobacteriota bacterium]|nr:hypothetical protein [Acidobacteriota bacterium]